MFGSARVEGAEYPVEQEALGVLGQRAVADEELMNLALVSSSDSTVRFPQVVDNQDLTRLQNDVLLNVGHVQTMGPKERVLLVGSGELGPAQEPRGTRRRQRGSPVDRFDDAAEDALHRPFRTAIAQETLNEFVMFRPGALVQQWSKPDDPGYGVGAGLLNVDVESREANDVDRDLWGDGPSVVDMKYLEVATNCAGGRSEELTDNTQPRQTPAQQIPGMCNLNDPDNFTFRFGPTRQPGREMDESVPKEARRATRYNLVIEESSASLMSSSRRGHNSNPSGGSVVIVGHHWSVFPVELVGERITLREIALDDLDAALSFASDPEVTRYLPFSPQTRTEERAAIEAMMAEARVPERSQYELAATDRQRGTIIGMGRIGLTPKQHRAADLGYLLRRDCWGQGLGTELASLLVAFGFTELGLHRIWAGHHPDNLASGRVLEKVGMIKEGRIREHLFAHGAWRDSLTYSILEHEWHDR